MDRDGFVNAVLDHKDRLHTYAAWLLHNVEDATDVTQEALTRLWVHRDKVRPEAARSWLLRTAHHLCLDQLRKRTTRAECELKVLPGLPDNSELAPEQAALLNDLRLTVGKALVSLSHRDRMVLLMREIQGMAYEEMSNVLGMPLGTLKAALHRARERLRRQLTAAEVQP